MNNSLLAGLSACLLVTEAQAQTMSLSDCVNYALSHNTNIEQKKLQEQSQELTLHTSRHSRLPEINASINQGFGFGRSTNRDGMTVDQTSANTRLGLSASMPLFTGFRIPNQIKADQYSLQAATENLRLAQKNVSINVAGYYLQALYYKGIVAVQRDQLALDKETLKRARELYDAGRKPLSEVATAEAQVALTEHALTEAEGNDVLARLDLMQVLNLEGDVTQFQIKEIDTTAISGDILPADVVFTQAVETYPSVMAAKYDLESSRHQLKVAKSYNLPSLSLSASYGNSYYHVFNQENYSFGKQLDLNGQEDVGLSLNIPIFSRYQTRNSIRKARLQIQSQEIALQDARQSLMKEIQQAYWNAMKARDNYLSAQKADASTSLAYHYEAERYAAGRGTSYDLQQARAKMEKSRQDELQARYEFLMRVRILEFYNNVPLN